MTVGELIAKLNIDAAEFDKGLSKAEKKLQTSGTMMGGIFRNAFSVAFGIGIFEALKQGIKSTVGEAFNFNIMMEQARIGFETMLGSAEKAQAFLEEMGRFAAKTPFEYPDLLDASKRMMAMDFAADEVLPTLKAVGDAAAGLGMGREGINRIILALAQMRAKAKVSGEEMRQLSEAGIPAWQMLADAMGKSTAEVMKLAERGLIPANKAVQVLVEGMEKRFPNMMSKMQDTWQGITSTIKDVWRMTIGAITQDLFKGVANWLKTVRDVATSFYDFFTGLRNRGVDTSTALSLALAKTFGPGVASIFSTLINAVQNVWVIIVKAAATIKAHWATIKPIVIGVVSAFLMFKVVTPIITGITTVTQILNGTLVATSGVLGLVSRATAIYTAQMITMDLIGTTSITVLTKLRVAFQSLLAAIGPVGWVILAVSAALTGGMALWSKYSQSVQQTNFDKMMQQIDAQNKAYTESIKKATEGTLNQADALTEAGKAANQNLQSFDEVHNIMEETADAAGGLDTGVLQQSLDEFEVPDLPTFDLSTILEQQKPTFAGFWEWIKQGAVNIWEDVKQDWNRFTGWVSSWGIWSWIGEKWGSIKTFAGNLWEGVKEKWKGFTGWVGSWAGPLWEGVKEKWDNFKTWAGDMWEGAKEKWGNFTGWVSEKWNNFKIQAGETWEGIKTNVQMKWEELKTNAPIAWENIKTSIQTRWESLKIQAGETWGNIKTGIEEKWNALKTNAPVVWENIKTSVQDRWNDLVSGASEKWDSIKTAITDRWEELKTNAPTVWENLKNEISQRWEDLKTNAPTTWESIKTEIINRWNTLKTGAPTTWENIKKEISDRWNTLKTDAPTTWESITTTITEAWGKLKSNAEETWEGIKETIRNAVNGIIGIINSLIRSWNNIHFKVPEINLGPLGVFGGWTISLPHIGEITPLAAGTNYIPQDMFAYLHEGEAVVPKEYNPAATGGGINMEALEQAVYRAFINALRVMQASARQDDRELVLKIDSRVLAQMTLPAIIKEGQRQGLNLVVRPQGV